MCLLPLDIIAANHLNHHSVWFIGLDSNFSITIGPRCLREGFARIILNQISLDNQHNLIIFPPNLRKLWALWIKLESLNITEMCLIGKHSEVHICLCYRSVYRLTFL